MSSDAPKLGTGLFGYRRSTVEQLMAESDARLREAEARLRAAETRVSELQRQLETLKRRNARMDQRDHDSHSETDTASGSVTSREPVQSGRGSWERSRTAMKEER